MNAQAKLWDMEVDVLVIGVTGCRGISFNPPEGVVHFTNLGQREVGDFAGVIGSAIHGLVVTDHNLAVLRGVHVQLYPSRTKRNGLAGDLGFEKFMGFLMTRPPADFQAITAEAFAWLRWLRQMAPARNAGQAGD